MPDSSVKARCNLFAVLRGIEYLLDNDAECKKLVEGTDLAIQFNIKDGPKGNLSIRDGKALMKSGKHKSSMILYFTSPEHFNKMIDGNANPIPLTGFHKIGFLTGPFMKLADKLNYYLRPEGDLLSDPDYFRMNTEITAYTAFFALAEIGNHDRMGRLSSAAMPDGILQVQIEDGIGIFINVEKGRLTCNKGIHDKPRAILSFRNLDAAHRVLNGKLDTYTGLGNGEMSMRGFIPMLDNMNPILDLVPVYLS
ncbi:MAG: hypothetical protein JEZ04_07200 [Spirochaetales bacterium]|nr:hypothetical protein [Spirochaetales bacterium]